MPASIYFKCKIWSLITKMKTKLYITFILLVFAASTCNMPADQPEKKQPASIQRDITYCTMGVVELKMDLYMPENITEPTPTAVYIHGGGWTNGNKSSTGGKDIRALTQAGFVVFSLDYRLAPEYRFPAMIEDVKCAIRSIRAHAEEYNVDPDHIGAYGESAGGHLASLLGTSDKSAGFDVGEYLEYSSRVQAVIDMYGPADFTVNFPGGYSRLKDKVFGGFDAALASPVTYISADDPPFLILHGDQDKLVPFEQSWVFQKQLLSANVPVTLVIVKNAGHGFRPVNGEINPAREEITQMIVDFFNETLK